MNTVTSFDTDHRTLERGVYVSRADGDIITFDLRFRRPYRDPLLTNAEMHSLEHVLAHVLRGGGCGGNIIYVGPMGCQTGFYVLMRGLTEAACRAEIMSALKQTAVFGEKMPGGSEIQCGNCRNLSVSAANAAAKEFLRHLK